MTEGIIRKRLDLLLRLSDTTTGLPVGERGVSFHFNGSAIRLASQGTGNYILINRGRENGLMQVNVNGYEPCTVTIDYDTLDESLPTVDVFLIPSEDTKPDGSFFTLSGQLSGLTAIRAVHLGKPLSGIREFDAKRNVMTVFMSNRRMNLVHTYYGLYHAEDQTFEDIEILRAIDEKRVLIKRPLTKEFATNAPIFRTIFGQADEEGNYLFRVRNNGANQKYLVKYIVGGDERFRVVDFSQPVPAALE